ncbi:hypothetical protein NEMBOFW57_005486 [Staphylotrichum longicolle]|uniref:Uncharacterized protein n=1 Tax=Staphylotrichum longicolle TaxID=669026 RepID=A0AAD4EWX3_9PEZI|nr:hypothetical protein NEMBOFW57_005486 [Staphylotrichum longicolle]
MPRFPSLPPLIFTKRVCTTHDHANPLAELFPNNATGVLNATLAIIPISLEAARRLIPPQYGILERAYRSLLPDFPEGMYPVMVQAAHDHDVQFRAYGITIDDFSRVGFEFPFLDLAGDGYSSYRWAPAQLISATNDIALEGSRAYGTLVSPAAYDPPCDAYRRLPSGASYFRASSLTSRDFVELEMTPTSLTTAINPFPLDFFRNITNQPTFANATSCDNMIRLFNTSMSVGEYAPVTVKGRVRARAFPFRLLRSSAEKEEATEWTGVYGVQVATPPRSSIPTDDARVCGDRRAGGLGCAWEGR